MINSQNVIYIINDVKVAATHDVTHSVAEALVQSTAITIAERQKGV